MQHKILKGIGFFAIAAIFFGIGLSVIAAVLNGKPNTGASYYGLPIGTYSTAAVLILVVAILGVVAGRRAFRLIKRQRPK